MQFGGVLAGRVGVAALAASVLLAAVPAHGQEASRVYSVSVMVPQMNDCLLADIDDAWAVQAPVEILDCAEPHNAQVFKTMPYPESGARPSVVMKRHMLEWRLACGQEHVLEWLGAPRDTSVPLRLVLMPRLPTDKQWEAGARWVVCTASHPKPSSYGAETIGTLPDLFAATPRIEWVECINHAPVSGRFSFLLGCTDQSRWMYTGYHMVKGKVTKQYPRDLQASANAVCAKESAAVARSGLSVKARAALFPKNRAFKRDPYAECFIPLAEWNGRL